MTYIGGKLWYNWNDTESLTMCTVQCRKQKALSKNGARRKDKAMIWAAASGHFETEIIHSPQFQKSVSLALKTTNKDFGMLAMF